MIRFTIFLFCLLPLTLVGAEPTTEDKTDKNSLFSILSSNTLNTNQKIDQLEKLLSTNKQEDMAREILMLHHQFQNELKSMESLANAHIERGKQIEALCSERNKRAVGKCNRMQEEFTHRINLMRTECVCSQTEKELTREQMIQGK
ncbi:hypothetical protein [Kaarinaea lacus]